MVEEIWTTKGEVCFLLIFSHGVNLPEKDSKTHRSRPSKSKAQLTKGKRKKHAVSTESESTDNEDGRRTKRDPKISGRQSKRSQLDESDAEAEVISLDGLEEVTVEAGVNDNNGNVQIPHVLIRPEMLMLVQTGSG